jgi:hypothetical protein
MARILQSLRVFEKAVQQGRSEQLTISFSKLAR